MKQCILTVLAILTAAGAFAEPVAQPAFRLLDGYLDKRAYDAEYGAKAGPWILIGTGAALGATSATIWFAGDAINESTGQSPMSHNQKVLLTAGFAAGAVVLTGIGVSLGLFPPVIDERAQYSAIYRETDPVLQETMAAARLKGMAETGKSARTVSGWVNLGVSGASIAFQILTNRDNGQPWSQGLFGYSGWSLGSIVGGATSLLVKSPEETLYEEYLFIAARTVKN
jgi:hypothetical protein